jgi:integrase/recombinase XerD
MRKNEWYYKKEVSRESIVADFLERKRLSGITATALDDLKGVLRRFFQFYKGELTDEIRLRAAVLEYLLGKKAEYYNKIKCTLSQFFSLCVEEGVIKNHPCKGLRYKPTSSRIVEHDERTIQELLKLPDKSNFVGLRDYTFMLFLMDTGCRPSEALQIRLKDVQDNFIIIREEVSKVRKERLLPLSLPVIQWINKLIRARHPKWDNNGYLFCSYTGDRIVTRHMQCRFRGYSKILGVVITPHSLRHDFALFYLRAGGNIFSLKAIMGHARLTMTEKYIALVQADIRNNHSIASPINTLLGKEIYRVTKIKK